MNLKYASKNLISGVRHNVGKIALVPVLFYGAAANAALDASVTTAIAGTSADISEAGTLIVGLAVIAMGFRWLKATFF